ncbi:MAG: flavodoxin family protein [Methanomassiliicoccus sp.]|nr:flavodoxin family protein [Methanomassiliicoccus sp.]
MKVVVLNGSPRKDGNTAALLKKMTEDHADVDLKYFDLVDMKIKPCISCMYCKTHELCSIKDDMNKVYNAVKEADAIVLGSPIYMGAETAWLKGAVDRMYAFLARNPNGPGYQTKLDGGKRAVAVFTCGNPQGDKVYSFMNDRFYSWLGLASVNEVKSFIVPGVNPTMNVMDLVAAQKAVDEVKQFLQ